MDIEDSLEDRIMYYRMTQEQVDETWGALLHWLDEGGDDGRIKFDMLRSFGVPGGPAEQDIGSEDVACGTHACIGGFVKHHVFRNGYVPEEVRTVWGPLEQVLCWMGVPFMLATKLCFEWLDDEAYDAAAAARRVRHYLATGEVLVSVSA